QRFEVLEKLGEGGGGVVRRAFDHALGKQIALKAADIRRPDDMYRLKREFRFFADIRHPNLVKLFELFANLSHCFFTMELIAGTDIVSWVRDRAADCVDYGQVANVAGQLASAIEAIHSAGQLHRDIKASNVMVTPEGRVVLLDFGLSTAICPRNRATTGEG